ncbi:Magnesium transporter MRS2-4 [Auxenochlorella protothecoides]|uniref:Magnesium transporter MRS2-4 n=1 Tax=Auxenochlorella protothecoides TaxID=3075 RepID=A0A087SBE0_AUXPR|nr:Magnesium transporter MRS2-4 [Auxenochlorella protothecoides]KFM23044.1 Magnesium transporter MRS2-4 [Auxenochlorella protothecoides]
MESAPLMLRGRAGEGSVRRGLSSTQGGIPPPSKTKPVILIDEEGHLSYTTLRKQALITDMALRHRDIRALEPQVALPYPPAILVRRQAIVLNLEGLKLIIGREKALVLSVPAPGDLTARCPADLANPLVQQLAAHIAMRAWPGSGDGAEGGLGASFSVATLEEIRGGATLPYELRALEGALLCLVRVLEREVGALERGVRPVLDRIRRGVLRSDLEELYESRTRLVRGLARVSRMKEILEELLDEEELMAGLEAPDPGEMEECEDLVEAYWLQVDALALPPWPCCRSASPPPEHLVNLDLDARRNQLVSLGLAIDLLLMAFECHMALTSIFGMNLTSGLEPLQPYSLWGIVALGAGAGALLTALQLDPEVAGEEYRSEARRSQPCFAL